MVLLTVRHDTDIVEAMFWEWERVLACAGGADGILP